MIHRHHLLPVLVGLGMLSAVACATSGDDAPGPKPIAASGPHEAGGPTEAPRELPLDLAKVKNVLVGLPPTDEETTAVLADPSALRPLIDRWMKTPEYDAKMLRFFQLAFQQTQLSNVDLEPQFFPNVAVANPVTVPRVLRNVTESFARTALALAATGRSFNETMTTSTFMMTPALMELYAFLDSWQVDNEGGIRDKFAEAHPGVNVVVQAAGGPIPLSETLDPKSPRYMHWYDPDVAKTKSGGPGCAADPLVFPAKQVGYSLHLLLHGSIHRRGACPRIDGGPSAAQLTRDDYETWKMVTVRAPRYGERTTQFYDLPRLRTTNELVLETPRVGFFTTLAFFANWPTNESNQMRVTANQMLIVATGTSIDGTDATRPPAEPGLDQVHAGNPACYACHKTMDPTRSILAATYSWVYHQQTDSAWSSQPGLFAYRGVVAPTRTIADLATSLAYHPLFAPAWVQKLCYYASSAPCPESDPELARIVTSFERSGYSWNTLVREFFSSPMVTNAKRVVERGASGPAVAVARRDQLCAMLNHRLGFEDACGLLPLAKASSVSRIAAGLPSDGYARGAVAPVLANDPTFFYRAGTEAICVAVAEQVVENPEAEPGVKQWSSEDPERAIRDFVHLVMGLASTDPRAAKATAVLRRHFDAAMASGARGRDALASTFVVACSSPSAIGIGL